LKGMCPFYKKAS